MNQNLFLDNLLSFEDQSLLKSFNLFIHLVGIGISSFQASATMNIKRVFELLWEGLNFEFFFDQLRLCMINFILESRNLASFLHEDLQFSLQIILLTSQQLQIIHPFSERGLSLGKSCLLNLYLFIKESRLIISSDKLSPEDIPFRHNKLILILLLLSLNFWVFDNRVEFGDFSVEILDLLSLFIHLLFLFLQLSAMFQESLIFLLMLKSLLCQGYFLCLDFLL